ncbi:ras-related protein Rab-13-like [Rhopilema esculentum]|uniref:ras-related protein Rab-13-like n=1 Tax=Rhopilema esculentum TaxID=499914 RepID=UPI0031CE50DA|eukprot:gene3290-1621_t
MGERKQYLFKVIIIGDSGVGKTCMLSRFAGEDVTKSHISTIGIDFKIRIIHINDDKVKLQIWDTAGQERYETITTQYYRRAHGVILVYDISSRHSFDNMRKWLKYVDEYASSNVKMIIVGNKCDLEVQRQVTPEEGQKLASQYEVPFYETSAYAYVNIDEAFSRIAKQIYEGRIVEERKEFSDGELKSTIPLDEKKPRQSCSC